MAMDHFHKTENIVKKKTLCLVSVSNILANKHIIIVYLVGSGHVHYQYCPGGQRTVYVHL